MRPSDSRRLLVLVQDSLADLSKKGEVTDRYYNPGNFFSQVDLVTVSNGPLPPVESLQRMVGAASLKIHQITPPRFTRTLGWNSLLLRPWLRESMKIIQSKPDVIRCHGNYLNSVLAAEIKKRWNIPIVLSMHTNPDVDVRRNTKGFMEWVMTRASEKLERRGLKSADRVIAVYDGITPYLKRLGVSNYRLIYNFVNPNHIATKDDYGLHKPVRIICPGRQFSEKNPTPIIEALSELPHAFLTLVGDGVLHEELKEKTKTLGLESRVEFIPALSNDELCRTLKNYDIFAIHCDFFGIPKTVIEAFLVGMPIVVNQRVPEPIAEYNDSVMVLVGNSRDQYLKALRKLSEDHEFRKKIGEAAAEYARRNFLPSEMEEKYVSLYEELIAAQSKMAFSRMGLSES